MLKSLGPDALEAQLCGQPVPAGRLVYYQLNYAARGVQSILLLFLVMLSAGTIALRYRYLEQFGNAGQKLMGLEFVVGAVFALLLVLLHRWDRRMIGNKLLFPISFCGRICYSLYLVHWPVVIVVSHMLYRWGLRDAWSTLLVTIPLGTGLSIAFASLFYWWVERHFLNPPQAATAVRA